MYKNFKVSEQEKKQILEMHGNHGYRRPLNESPQIPHYIDSNTYGEPIPDSSTDIKTQDPPKKDVSSSEETSKPPILPPDTTVREVEDLLKEVVGLVKSDLEQNGYTVKFDKGYDELVLGEKNVLFDMSRISALNMNPFAIFGLSDVAVKLYYNIDEIREIINILGGVTDKIRHRDKLRVVMTPYGVAGNRNVSTFYFSVRGKEYAELGGRGFAPGKKITDYESGELNDRLNSIIKQTKKISQSKTQRR